MCVYVLSAVDRYYFIGHLCSAACVWTYTYLPTNKFPTWKYVFLYIGVSDIHTYIFKLVELFVRQQPCLRCAKYIYILYEFASGVQWVFHHVTEKRKIISLFSFNDGNGAVAYDSILYLHQWFLKWKKYMNFFHEYLVWSIISRLCGYFLYFKSVDDGVWVVGGCGGVLMESKRRCFKFNHRPFSRITEQKQNAKEFASRLQNR